MKNARPMTAREQLQELAELVKLTLADSTLLQQIDGVAALIVTCLDKGGKVLTCGNGGSTTDAAHLAEELIGRYRSDRAPKAAINLVADASALTCIANDYGFGAIFERQVEALAGPDDVLVVFSTSGNSENVLRAITAAKKRGATTVAFTGETGGKCVEQADFCIRFPSTNTARIQELHTFALHVICEAFEPHG